MDYFTQWKSLNQVLTHNRASKSLVLFQCNSITPVFCNMLKTWFQEHSVPFVVLTQRISPAQTLFLMRMGCTYIFRNALDLKILRDILDQKENRSAHHFTLQKPDSLVALQHPYLEDTQKTLHMFYPLHSLSTLVESLADPNPTLSKMSHPSLKRVLLVHSNAYVTHMLVMTLSHCTLEIASTLTEALNKDPYLFDVILTDLYLEDGEGIGVFLQLKQHFKFSEIIVSSEYKDINTIVSTFFHGAVDFLTFPYFKSVVQNAIQQAAEHARVKRYVSTLN